MSLKPVLVVIPQRTLRFLSGLGSTGSGCPPVLVARRQTNSEQQCSSEEGPSTRTRGREIVPISMGDLEESSQPTQLQIDREPSRSVDEEEEGEGADKGGTGGSGDEALESEDAGSIAPSRSVKHNAVEQRRKKKISDAVQQLLEAIQPPSPAGKMTRADILERAVDKIKALKEENKQLRAKIDNLPQPGEETELYGELSKQITEFLALKSQLEHMEKQRSESRDQETESHDLGIESHDLEPESHDCQDKDITSCANPSPSSTVITVTSSSNSASTASENSPTTTNCSVAVAHTHINSTASDHGNVVPTSSQMRIASNEQAAEEDANGRSVNVSATTEVLPPVSAHQPWPVTSILSQDNTGSHCQHATTTNNSHVVPTSCHGSRNLTTSVDQNSSTVRNISAHISPVSSVSNISAHISPVSSVPNISAHIQNTSPVSSVSTNSLFHQPDVSVCRINSSMSSSAQQRIGVTDNHFRAGQNNATSHLRTGTSSLASSLHGNYQYHHNSSEPQQVRRYSRERQREVACGGFFPSRQTQERYCSTTTTGTQVQQHSSSSAIVQPWVESTHRPRPLHHVTNTTPMPRVSPQTQYDPLHHHNEQHRQNAHSHTGRFMPYPYPRMDRQSSSSTFSHGSWSHDNHVITPVGNSGRDVAPQGRSYASSPFEHPHLRGNSFASNYDQSRNYSTTQGHPSWMPYFTPPSQQNCSRNSSGMLSHDSQATPLYPIQPHPHCSGSSSASPAVWRPYSERTRSSGFCLADILSLPSETEATPLSLDVTPPTGHHSFLVNRLLEDI